MSVGPIGHRAVRDLVRPAETLGLPEWAGRLALVGIVIGVAIAALTILGWVVPRVSRRVARRTTPRTRQRQTAMSLLASSLRYVVAIAALTAIFFLLAGGGPLGAVSGAALVLVVVSFASQRLLADMIAGFFVLFEDQYAVGDVVRLEPSGITGVVEELGLRATVVRDANGDRCFVPNGQVTGVRRLPSAGRGLRLLLVTNAPDRVARLVPEVVRAAPGAALREVSRTRIGDDLWTVSAAVAVAGGADTQAQAHLTAVARARLGELLLAEPAITAERPIPGAHAQAAPDEE